MPVMDSETYKSLKPYIELAEKIGAIIAQALPGNIEKLDVTYCGELAEMQFDILTRTMLQAILNPILTEPVNLINAPTIAKKRGIMVTEARRSESDGYRSIIIATAASDKGEFSVEATHIKEPTIIGINGYRVDVKPEGTMIIARYRDLPGTIGAIGTKLGQHGINIATMQVGRKEIGGEAVMVLKVDQSVPAEVIEEVKKLENVDDAVAIEI